MINAKSRYGYVARAVISVQILKGVAEKVGLRREGSSLTLTNRIIRTHGRERKEREGKNNIRPDQVSVISSYTVVTRSDFTCLATLRSSSTRENIYSSTKIYIGKYYVKLI